jgi:aminocarboxymuconate-semialdehyde decarboxylase
MASAKSLQRSAAGLCFVGCGIAGHAHAGVQRKREVVVSKRAHHRRPAHCAIGGAGGCERREARAPRRRPGTSLQQVADERMRTMDEQGIDMEALSINPVWYGWDRDVVAK